MHHVHVHVATMLISCHNNDTPPPKKNSTKTGPLAADYPNRPLQNDPWSQWFGTHKLLPKLTFQFLLTLLLDIFIETFQIKKYIF